MVLSPDEDERASSRYRPRMAERWRSLVARGRALPPARVDLWVAVVLGIEFQLEVTLGSSGSARALVAAHAALLALAAAVALRRRFPVSGAVVAFAFFALTAALGNEVSGSLFAPFLVLLFLNYSMAVHTDARRFPAATALIVALYVTEEALNPEGIDGFVFVGLVILALPFLAGRLVRGRIELNRALAAKTVRLARDRAERAERAAIEERTRIAGELHDVVAHALSAMVVQAGGARRLAGADDDRARDAFAAVEGTGREALGEMRRLLGVLRRADEDIALAPQPSLAHVGTLAGRARAAGLPVELHVEGEPRPLSPGVDLTAYRVVQEALRRAVELGGAQRAEVSVRYGERSVEVEVLDDGRVLRERTGPRRLLGMSERVAIYGGELHTGARGEGGNEVRARLPVGETA